MIGCAAPPGSSAPCDRAAAAAWRCAARAVGLPLSVLRRMTPTELRWLLRRARRRAERARALADRRLDVAIAALDVLEEGRLP